MANEKSEKETHGGLRKLLRRYTIQLKIPQSFPTGCIAAPYSSSQTAPDIFRLLKYFENNSLPHSMETHDLSAVTPLSLEWRSKGERAQHLSVRPVPDPTESTVTLFKRA